MSREEVSPGLPLVVGIRNLQAQRTCCDTLSIGCRNVFTAHMTSVGVHYLSHEDTVQGFSCSHDTALDTSMIVRMGPWIVGGLQTRFQERGHVP